jgi:triosephosphate isomerase (TIM)
MARKKMVAGNWKMFTNRESAQRLAAAVATGAKEHSSSVDVLVCPPFPYLGIVRQAIEGGPVLLGAQNCFHEKEGAFTGEVSPVMLADVGCRYVVLGHSERRHKLGECSEFISKKVHAAVEAGLRVIVCFGETEIERKEGRTEAVLEMQLIASLARVGADKVGQLVLAYEPVWAIGTGQNATPEQAQAAHVFLRQKAAGQFGPEAAEGMIILYGGSVKPDNAATLFAQADVDGGLIGGASLKADEFLKIVASAGPVG